MKKSPKSPKILVKNGKTSNYKLLITKYLGFNWQGIFFPGIPPQHIKALVFQGLLCLQSEKSPKKYHHERI